MRVCFVLAVTVPSVALAADPVDTAIERALPYVADRGAWWIEEKDCVSCHRTAFTTWSLSLAAEAGFEVDRETLAAQQRWSADSLLEPTEDDPEKPTGAGNLEGVAQVLLATDGRDGELDAKSRKRLLGLLVDGQKQDGTWKAGGQLPMQRRPGPETALVSTAWIALALGTDDSEASQAARSRALAKVNATDEAVSTEWAVVRLLLAAQSGDETGVASWTAKLREGQRPDGGWGWLVDESGNALGTGMALHALHRAEVPSSDPAVRRAVDFLVKSQAEDGSWPVPGTKKKAKGEVVETATYWGTCWATLALLETRTPSAE